MTWSRRRFLGAGAVGAAALAVAACASGDDGDRGGAADAGQAGPGGARVVRYGPARAQHVELTHPSAVPGGGRVPTVVLLHGGFWSNQYGLDLMRPLVPTLTARGWAVVNVEYRRVGDDGGGWTGTFLDVAAAVDGLGGPAFAAVDPARVVLLGHSAGGHLAAWAAGRGTLPTGAPGAAPRVVPVGAVAEAGLLDLRAASDQGLGGGAVDALLGGRPAGVPDRFDLASPIARLPIGVPVELVHGAGDGIVPLDQSTRYRDAAVAAGDAVRLTEVPGDHFALIDPRADAWAAALAAIARLLG